MSTASPRPDKQLPFIPVIAAAALLCLLAAVFGPRGPRVLAQATEIAPSPEPSEGGSGEVRAHVIDSPADCANSGYRKVETAGQEGETVFAVPPNPDGPVLVDIGLYIVEVTGINEVDNTFHIEGYMDLIWCDPRLAFDPAKTGQLEEIFLEEEAQARIDHIWWPDIEFVNESGPREVENEELIILPDGTINYEERFSGELEARYDLRRFPFDRQRLETEIESFAWDVDYVTLHREASKIGFSAEFQIPEWSIDAVETRIEDRQEVRDRKPFSEFLMEIEVSRFYGYYLWKIMAPLVILVAISWSVFWMIGDGLKDRMSVSLTGILTVVAYQFIVSEGLPKVPYFTLMDSVLTLSFVAMALTVLQNIYVNILYLQEKADTATRVDKTCRWLFPAAYFAGVLGLSLWYLLS